MRVLNNVYPGSVICTEHQTFALYILSGFMKDRQNIDRKSKIRWYAPRG